MAYPAELFTDADENNDNIEAPKEQSLSSFINNPLSSNVQPTDSPIRADSSPGALQESSSSQWSMLSRSKTFIISSMVEVSDNSNTSSSLLVVNIILDLNVFSGIGTDFDDSSGELSNEIDFIDNIRPWCSPCAFGFISNIDIERSIVSSGCLILAAQLDSVVKIKFRIDAVLSSQRFSTNSSTNQTPSNDICSKEVLLRHSVAVLANILTLESSS